MRERFGNFDLPAKTSQFMISPWNFTAGLRPIRRASAFARRHRSRRKFDSRIRLDGEVSQGAHGPARNTAIAAIDDGFPRGLQRVFDPYGEAAAIDADNLKIDTIVHVKTPAQKFLRLLPVLFLAATNVSSAYCDEMTFK
jgi:hypothetical protein